MAYRNKTYIAFDADNDIRYYRLMQAWKQNDNTDFNFYDAHDLNNIMSYSSEETIKRRLSERMQNTSRFVLLVGENTKYLYKYVKWEIELALRKDLPIIVTNLNGRRLIDYDKCPAILKEELAIHISFNSKILQHSLENWGDSHIEYRKQGKTGPYYYKDFIFENLGLND